MYKIDKSVEVPPDTRGGVRKYPWTDMEVGDSFFVPHKDGKKVGVAIPQFMREAGFKTCQRTVEENGVKGARYWRVK